MQKLGQIYSNIVKYAAAAVFCVIFFLVFFMQENTIFACKRDFSFSNITLLFAFLICLFAFIFARRYFLQKSVKLKNREINCDKIVKIATIVIFFVSLYISHNIFFETGWDSGSAIIPAARFLSKNDTSILAADYFSYYPNNSLLILIYSYILKFNDYFGIFVGDTQLMSIVCVNVFFASIAIYLTYKISKKLFGTLAAVIGYILSVVLINFSGWNVICYSDSFSIIFPVLTAYVYTHCEKPIAKYVSIFALGVLGYMIKPQNSIIVIAITITDIFRYFKKENIKNIIKISAVCLAVILGLSISLNTAFKSAGFNPDKNKEIGMTHFFMMGLHPASLGGYNADDVANSFACENQEVRKQMNIDVAEQRLRAMGIVGYGKFLMKKTLANYGDGLFSWGMEGQFYMKTIPDINEKSSPYLKNIFYTFGSKFNRYAVAEQFVWTSVIALVFFLFFLTLTKRNRNFDITALTLAILGLTLFELLFEARARYLYCYVPIYIILAAGGIRTVLNITDKIKFKRKERISK